MASTRTFTRAQLDALGLPDDLATEANAAVWDELAVELHREQIDSRRWVSVHELIFRAPDDGKAYRVTYEQGLTEHQDGTDPWNLRDHVVAEEVERYEVAVTAWRPVEEHPADREQPKPHPTGEERLAALADRLDDIAATTREHNIGPTHDAYRAGLRVAARIARQQATGERPAGLADLLDDDTRPVITVDLDQPTEPPAVPRRNDSVLCAHDYGLMRDSCPGCDHEQETPHEADPITVRPSWAKRDMRRCRRCALVPSHKIHRAKAVEAQQ